ncbi:uncharacterized protein LOC129312021 [Prosopis cineraria]|uniref:uncharacterized protein LOC129312021 n=1 Tax=Prosopis cineraria TaxID=364024 RepID=UPI00240F53A0|nr:uncharacterized protein LOC129312021 [Prosopis cineraria]
MFLYLALMASVWLCSPKFLAVIVLLSALPIGTIISLHLANPPTHVYYYHSNGWFRECGKWDDQNRRFIVGFVEGGIGQIPVTGVDNEVLEEIPVVKDVDLAGNSTLGIVIDPPRNRLLAVHAEPWRNRFSALAAYDLQSWKRLFLTQLSGSGDEKSLANDVAVDAEGNAYVTDVKASKIWKVGVEGKLKSIIRNPLFKAKAWYKNLGLAALNGIVYHPDGFLIVVHTYSGNLLKIDLSESNDEVYQVKLIMVEGGPLTLGDGLELVSQTKLVVAAKHPTARLVESCDGWETASVMATFSGLRHKHRSPTTVTVKDGKVYINHLLGMGYPRRKHAFVQADFGKFE